MYTIDDSSGFNIGCVLPLEPRQENPRNVFAPGAPIPAEYSDFDVGHVVDLRGPIIPYRRQKAIKIRRMKLVPTTQHELLLWERRFRFRTEVLDVSWTLSDAEVRRYRKEAERADARDLRLAAGKRKRRAHRENGQGAAEKAEDPYKLKKRVARPVGACSDKPAHRPREPSNDAKVTSHGKQPSPVSVPEEISGGGNGEDPCSLKSVSSKRPVLSTTLRASPSRKPSSQDDPSRITKRGSKRPLKHSAQSSAVAPDEASTAKEPSSSASSQAMPSGSETRSLSSKHSSVGEAESPKASQKRRSTSAQKPRTRLEPTDDPYAIKAKYTRRTSASKPVALGQDTRVDPFKITKSCKGPCSEKISNINIRGPDKTADATTGKDSKPGREYEGTEAVVGVDDPFKLRKRVLN